MGTLCDTAVSLRISAVLALSTRQFLPLLNLAAAAPLLYEVMFSLYHSSAYWCMHIACSLQLFWCTAFFTLATQRTISQLVVVVADQRARFLVSNDLILHYHRCVM